MLELGRGSRGEAPVLRDGVVVAALRASRWREAATAVVGDREWVFGRRRRELVGRLSTDPEDATRFRTVSTSGWRGTWRAELDGVVVDAATASWWRGTRRFTAGGRTVAEAGSTGPWSRRPTLTADDTLPLDAQVFLLWVQLVLDRRQTAAAAASGGGGGGGG
ncbi:hypothetical protein [Geodermatophilus sp. URMC 62]|uniref:hypothetical protein n=1 Tax=Geodermatophilus sp. URMC 62 TaxID=3423414 RepID=UPI00406C0925